MRKGVTLSAKLYGIVGIITLLLFIVGVVSFFGLRYVVGRFTYNIEVDAAQMEASMEARVLLGNAVQSYKNYLLRKDSKYISAFRENVSEMKKQIDAFEKLADDEREKSEVAAVKEHFSRYENGIDELVKARETSDDVIAIDKQIKGVDRPLAEALKRLDESAMNNLKEKKSYTLSIASKIELLILVVLIVAVLLAIILSTTLVRNIMKNVLSLKEAADRASRGDLTVDVPIMSDDEIGELATSFNTMIVSLRQIVGQLLSATDMLTEGASELNTTVGHIVDMVEEEKGKSGQIATASAQMSQTVTDIARSASDMAVSATNTLKVADDGSAVVGKTVREVQEISKTVSLLSEVITSLGNRSKQIGEIINVIKGIADQTNLLALNAAIEAARAGEQGRGFAVVADEVRKLAERTSMSTTEISSMISTIQGETEKAVRSMQDGTRRVDSGVELAKEAGTSLDKIVQSVSGLQSMVHHIASATEEMSTVSETISNDIESIASVAGETSASSHQILQAASGLSKLSSDLHAIVAQFDIGDKARGKGKRLLG
ncbi:MAG: methyl-accepting chemotaxis protein [Nitrospirae bacterium]|uniref:methyl-accepting chemotaxis protein n=1 Tax=Candidatus Magnetobacterium casense TaxID=1455061 RepID=UPI00058C953D|nr:methyl-accepting chemotaxis protein [Candidatus Magnetobacterium casensis]MBF0338453.1 methyl-accepting chemotaxis protein [Nitrospirota bacterium]